MGARAYSYIRFSSLKQATGDSLRRQTELARAYAQRHGLELDEALTYRDLGVSAYDKSNVETGALASFLAAVKKGTVSRGSTLLVEQLDRLSRADVYTAFNLLHTLLDAGITVVTLSPEYVYRKDSADLGALMMSLVTMHRAHDESYSKSQRLRSIWESKRERREKMLTKECPRWLAPREDRSGFDVIPARVQSVRKVFDMTIAGYGASMIVRKANLEQWSCPSKSGTWHTSLIPRLLNNPAVLGEYHPKKVDGKGNRTSTGEIWKDYYPRIVTDDIYRLAQATKAGRAERPARRDNGYRNIFQGLLCCGICQASFVRKNKQSTKQQGYAIYMCADRIRGLTTCPSENAANLEQRLLMAVYADAYEHVSSEDELRYLQDQIALLRQKLQEARLAVNRIADAIAETDSPTLIQRLPQAEKKERDIKVELDAKELELAAFQMSLADKDHLMTSTFFKDFQRVQDESEVEFRSTLREKLLRLIERAYAFPDSNCIAVKYRQLPDVRLVPLNARFSEQDANAVREYIDTEGLLKAVS